MYVVLTIQWALSGLKPRPILYCVPKANTLSKHGFHEIGLFFKVDIILSWLFLSTVIPLYKNLANSVSQFHQFSQSFVHKHIVSQILRDLWHPYSNVFLNFSWKLLGCFNGGKIPIGWFFKVLILSGYYMWLSAILELHETFCQALFIRA